MTDSVVLTGQGFWEFVNGLLDVTMREPSGHLMGRGEEAECPALCTIVANNKKWSHMLVTSQCLTRLLC